MNMYDVLVKPVLSEKTTSLAVSNQYGFVVHPDATKPDIKKAVENIFNVKVSAVNTLVRKGKSKRFRGRLGVRSDEKRAYVRLLDGQSISYDGV